MKKIFTILLIASLFFLTAIPIQAQDNYQESIFEETLEGVVTKIRSQQNIDNLASDSFRQDLEILITQGSLKGQTINIVNGEIPSSIPVVYKEKDKLVIYHSKDMNNDDLFFISDFVRRDSLLVLFVLFAILAVFVGRIWGITSILGMAYSFLVIFKFILPQIIEGSNPVLTTIAGSVLIIPVTFYLSHGFNPKTHIALLGTFISLIITGVLAWIFVNYSKLTGFSTEEAGFLNYETQGIMSMKGILLSGIIIGTLGILDDVTVSQSSVIFQLNEVNSKLNFKQLFSKAMKVGHDHVSSMINTLVLVYAGASMPLLLLFINNPRPFSQIINYEIIANEIVRTLVGSIGLISAVPITTYLAALYIANTRKL